MTERHVVKLTAATLEKALRQIPDDRDLVYLLAVLYKKAGAYDDAVTLYRVLLQTDKNDSLALNNLANIEFARGEFQAAIARYKAGAELAGISPPVLRILADNRLSATATLDLDVMNGSRPPAEGFDPLRMLTGSVPAKVTGRLMTENGSGRFELESAELGGIPLPRALVSQLVSRYSVSADEPNGVDLDAPFDLPSSIREIRVEPGLVTVLQ